MAEHVADASECNKLLPRQVLVDARRDASALGYEPVWIVDESSGRIERGTMIDTYNDRYFTFEVFYPEGNGFDLIPTSDWLPLPDKE